MICAWYELRSEISHFRPDSAVSDDVLDELFSVLETVIPKWLAECHAGWRREMPIGGEPADVPEIVQANADWLAASNHPKLFINAEPGSLLIGRFRDFCRTPIRTRSLCMVIISDRRILPRKSVARFSIS